MNNRKTINIGRVKGSMVYSGTDFQVEKPLEGDLYLHNIEYAFYQYVAGNWVKITDFEEHSIKAEGIKIATSDNYNTDSDEEILTSKAVNKIVNNAIKYLGVLSESPEFEENIVLNALCTNDSIGTYTFTYEKEQYLMLINIDTPYCVQKIIHLTSTEQYVITRVLLSNGMVNIILKDKLIDGDNLEEVSNDIKKYVDNKVSEIVNSAPETLDTLKELSEALGNDKDFATTITNELSKKINKTDVINTISAVAENNPTDKPISAYKAYELQRHIDTANANRKLLKDKVDKMFDENTTYNFSFENNKLKITSSNEPSSSITLNCDLNPISDYNSNFAIYNTPDAIIYDGSTATWKISNGWKYYIVVDSNGKIQYASYHPTYVGINSYASHSDYSEFYNNPVRKNISTGISLVIPSGSFLLVCNRGDSTNAAHSDYTKNIDALVSFLTNGKIKNANDDTRNALNTQGSIPDNIRLFANDSFKVIKGFKETEQTIEITIPEIPEIPKTDYADLGNIKEDPKSTSNTVLNNITKNGVYYFTYRYDDYENYRSEYYSYIMLVFTQNISRGEEVELAQFIFEYNGSLKTFERYRTGYGNWYCTTPGSFTTKEYVDAKVSESSSSGALYEHFINLAMSNGYDQINVSFTCSSPNKLFEIGAEVTPQEALLVLPKVLTGRGYRGTIEKYYPGYLYNDGTTFTFLTSEGTETNPEYIYIAAGDADKYTIKPI